MTLNRFPGFNECQGSITGPKASLGKGGNVIFVFSDILRFIFLGMKSLFFFSFFFNNQARHDLERAQNPALLFFCLYLK